jgi:hypothetical protein
VRVFPHLLIRGRSSQRSWTRAGADYVYRIRSVAGTRTLVLTESQTRSGRATPRRLSLSVSRTGPGCASLSRHPRPG